MIKSIIPICDIVNNCIECGFCNQNDISDKNWIYHEIKQERVLYDILTNDMLCYDIDFCVECGICHGLKPCGNTYCIECGCCDKIDTRDNSFKKNPIKNLI